MRQDEREALRRYIDLPVELEVAPPDCADLLLGIPLLRALLHDERGGSSSWGQVLDALGSPTRSAPRHASTKPHAKRSLVWPEAIGADRPRARNIAELLAQSDHEPSLLAQLAASIDSLPGEWFTASRAPALSGLLLEVMGAHFARYGVALTLHDDVIGLVVDRLDVRAGMTVLDPAVGSGRLLAAVGLRAGQTASLSGGDLSPRRLRLAKLHFTACDLPLHGLSLSDGTSVPAVEGAQHQYDRVVCAVPVARRLEESALSTEGRFIESSLARLRPTGKAVLLVRSEALGKGGPDVEMRRKLVESGFVSEVISLRPDVRYGAWDAASLLVLEKQGDEDRSVCFRAVGETPSSSGEDGPVTTVSLEQLARMGFDLDPGHHGLRAQLSRRADSWRNRAATGVTLSRDQHRAFLGLEELVRRGGVGTLVGAQGTGKSMILRILVGVFEKRGWRALGLPLRRLSNEPGLLLDAVREAEAKDQKLLIALDDWGAGEVTAEHVDPIRRCLDALRREHQHAIVLSSVFAPGQIPDGPDRLLLPTDALVSMAVIRMDGMRLRATRPNVLPLTDAVSGLRLNHGTLSSSILHFSAPATSAASSFSAPAQLRRLVRADERRRLARMFAQWFEARVSGQPEDQTASAMLLMNGLVARDAAGEDRVRPFLAGLLDDHEMPLAGSSRVQFVEEVTEEALHALAWEGLLRHWCGRTRWLEDELRGVGFEFTREEGALPRFLSRTGQKPTAFVASLLRPSDLRRLDPAPPTATPKEKALEAALSAWGEEGTAS